MGLNLGGQCFQSFLPSSQSEHSVPVLGEAEGQEKQSFPSCTDSMTKRTFCCSQNHQVIVSITK